MLLIFFQHISHDFDGKCRIIRHDFRGTSEVEEFQFHVVNAVVAGFPQGSDKFFPVNAAGTGNFVLVGDAVIVMKYQVDLKLANKYIEYLKIERERNL